ncbi:MAG: hypothetical protein M3Q67_04820 [Actinomycetota bacterium]|nr:hypothetical protein [Actinomycetota bacterium]
MSEEPRPRGEEVAPQDLRQECEQVERVGLRGVRIVQESRGSNPVRAAVPDVEAGSAGPLRALGEKDVGGPGTRTTIGSKEPLPQDRRGEPEESRLRHGYVSVDPPEPRERTPARVGCARVERPDPMRGDVELVVEAQARAEVEDECQLVAPDRFPVLSGDTVTAMRLRAADGVAQDRRHSRDRGRDVDAASALALREKPPREPRRRLRQRLSRVDDQRKLGARNCPEVLQAARLPVLEHGLPTRDAEADRLLMWRLAPAVLAHAARLHLRVRAAEALSSSQHRRQNAADGPYSNG